MPEPQCLDAGPPDPLIETIADLSARVAALEARLAPKPRHQANGRRMTRLDRCPYGFRPHPRNPARLVEDPLEQRTILALIEARQNPALSLRGLGRLLDSLGYRTRSGKPWLNSHGLIRSVLKRYSAETSADATARVLERIAAGRGRNAAAS